uniref:Trans-2,3-enoyl-CoA reductase n=1 Tax=Mus musculus TaxID=10090 RepID=A0A1D5RLT5_MOUSE
MPGPFSSTCSSTSGYPSFMAANTTLRPVGIRWCTSPACATRSTTSSACWRLSSCTDSLTEPCLCETSSKTAPTIGALLHGWLITSTTLSTHPLPMEFSRLSWHWPFL